MSRLINNDHPREKCAVIGVYAANDHAASYVRQGLGALQHRGQESTGISVYTTTHTIKTYKGMGFVPFVLTDDKMHQLGNTKMAIGHNRYGTSGDSSVETAQPLSASFGKYEISIGHNGNIPDITKAQKKFLNNTKSLSDTSLLATVLAKERGNFSSWEETFAYVLPYFKGAYCLICLTNDGSIYAVRDPFGIRPLVLGKFNDGWIIASESVALDVIGAEFIRDVQPGEIVNITPEGKLISNFFGDSKHPLWCIFEYIYFSRPDSFINGRRVRFGREESGKLLAERISSKGITPEVVIPTFDSGYPAAKGVSEALGLPIVDAITTSHYVGRTFIQPGQENRIKAVSGKHNIIPDEIIGKKVVVVDDSAVRLTTSHILARGLKSAGAKEVVMAFASPPVVRQCDMGIDMRSKSELPAAAFEDLPFEEIEKKVAEYIGADNVVYLPIEETALAFGGAPKDFYYYPFGGPHPIRDKQVNFRKRKRKSASVAQIVVLVSGNGTNLQVLLDEIEKGQLPARISHVISNNANAKAIARATKHGISHTVLSFNGSRSNSTERKTYEKQVLMLIKKEKPDFVLLSGWNFVLSDDFLTVLQEEQIPVINQHPSLLPKGKGNTVATSRGSMPVFRGANAIEQAFNQKALVSGFSLHQVIPGSGVDVGPVILTAEVRRHPKDTLQLWHERIASTEHLFLPTGIKRIIHVVCDNNIDISKGDFPW